MRSSHGAPATFVEGRYPRWQPVAMVLLIGLCWGAVFPLNRMARLEGIPFLPFVFWQCLGAAVIFIVIAIPLRALPKLGRRHLISYLVLGGATVALPYTILALAAAKVPAGVLGLVQPLEPMMTYVLVLIFAMERFRWLRVSGLLLGLAGVLLIVVPEASLPSPDMAGWVLLGLAIPLGWALFPILAIVLRPPETRALPFSIGILLATCLLLLPVLAITESWWFFDGTLDRGDWALAGVIMINVLVWVVSLECIWLAGPVIFSMWAYIGTLTSVGFGMLLFGERHSIWIWVALALLFAGLSLVTRVATRGEEAAVQ